MDQIMNLNTYTANVLATESKDIESITSRYTPEIVRLLHSASGLATEAGEFIDPIKKHLYYGKPLDKTNLIEELGDLLWYITVACDVLDTSLSEIMQINNDKLALRYKGKFTQEAAINRNLSAERNLLETETQGE